MKSQDKFTLESAGPASFSGETLPLAGRLEVYVKGGSQYGTWRQFPEAIRYEVRLPSGATEMTIDVSMNISDSEDTYDAYADEPGNQVVGKDFEVDLFARLVGDRLEPNGIIRAPGRYGMRAHYESWVSNWLELDVAP
jgi:hypothetical protein